MPDKSNLRDKSDPSRSPPPSPALLASIVDQLACPACLSRLEMQESRLICTGCRRVYPILDGIPALIADRSAAPNPE